MNASDPPDPRHGPLIEADPQATYTLDLVAETCGVSSKTILRYREQGLIPRSAGADHTDQDRAFGEDTVHRLKRIEYLREAYGMDTAALKLTLRLMDELDRLRHDLRSRA